MANPKQQTKSNKNDSKKYAPKKTQILKHIGDAAKMTSNIRSLCLTARYKHTQQTLPANCNVIKSATTTQSEYVFTNCIHSKIKNGHFEDGMRCQHAG